MKGTWEMKNWYTTLAGICAGLPALINVIWPFASPDIITAITAMGAFFVGLAAKDYNETGK